MGRIRLGHAALRLRLPQAARPIAPALADEAQAAFLPALLRHFVAAVEDAAPAGAFIRIRYLRLRTAATLAGFRNGSLAEAAARDLAEQVLDDAPVRSLSTAAGPLEAEVQVWANQAEWWACRLDAALARREGPEGRQEEIGALTRQISALPRHVRAALRHTVTDAPQGSALNAPLPATLAQALDLGTPTPPPAGDAQTFPARPSQPPAAASETDPAPPEPSGPPMHEANRNDARLSAASDAPGLPPRTSTPDRDISLPGTDPDQAAGSAPRPRPARAAQGGHRPGPARRAPSAPLQSVEPKANAAPPGTERSLPARPNPVITPPGAEPPPPAADAVRPHSPGQVPTNWGGAAYLLNIALALEIPERLWRIGLDEGETLAAMIDHLTGAPGDPLPLSLRTDPGAAPAAPLPVPGWAREELVAGTLDAARARARGDALPDRVAERYALLHPEDIWNTAHWLAALHAAIIEDLLDLTLEPDGLRGILRQSGTLTRTDDEIRLQLPLSAIDLDLRRQGLDRSPGFLPWLDRRFVIDFVPDANDHAEGAVL